MTIWPIFSRRVSRESVSPIHRSRASRSGRDGGGPPQPANQKRRTPAQKTTRLAKRLEADDRCAERSGKFRFLDDNVRERVIDSVADQLRIDIFVFEKPSHEGDRELALRLHPHGEGADDLEQFP